MTAEERSAARKRALYDRMVLRARRDAISMRVSRDLQECYDRLKSMALPSTSNESIMFDAMALVLAKELTRDD